MAWTEMEFNDPAEEVKYLRRCMNGLFSMLALSAEWSDDEPVQILSRLLDALLSVLSPDFAWGLLRAPDHGAPVEMVKTAPSSTLKNMSKEIGEVLSQWCAENPLQRPAQLRRRLGEKEVSIYALGLGLEGEFGLVAVGSQRTDFPEETERLVLHVAANQAVIRLQQSKLLGEQKRLAGELEHRVAERTTELADANEELRKEVAESQRKEEKLRLNEDALRQAHARLERSEERWRSVFENSAIGVALGDLNGRFIATNPVLQKMLGYTEEELQNLTFLDITVEEFRDRNWSLVGDLLQGKVQQFQIEKQYRRKGGSLVWVHNNVSMVPGTERVPQFLMALSEDITERKRGEMALHAAMEERARLATFRAEISVGLSRQEDLKEILHSCASAVVRHLDAAFARIWTLSSDGRELQLQASAGKYTRLDGVHSRIAVGQLKIGLIAQERKPHITNDVQNDPRVSDKDWARRENMVSFAGYPLILEDRLVGVIGMFAEKPLTESTLEALAFAASVIAQGIDRKRAEEALKLQVQVLQNIPVNA